MDKNALLNTALSHHEPGNEYCRFCDRADMMYPIMCDCGGLIHRDGECSEADSDSMPELCDRCGAARSDGLL